jgi:hypothetical protein
MKWDLPTVEHVIVEGDQAAAMVWWLEGILCDAVRPWPVGQRLG